MTQEQSKMIDLERILDEERSPFGVGEFSNRENEVILKAMREAIRQALELAAEEAQIDEIPEYDGMGGIYGISVVNKQSILNCINKVK